MTWNARLALSMPVALLLLGAISICTAESESWRRIGVIVSSRRGMPSDKVLQYTHEDARRVNHVLSSVGGVAPEDLFSIQSDDSRHLKQRLAYVGQTVQRALQSGQKVFLLFYYSGHGGAEAFHIGGKQVPFSDVKSWISANEATLRMFVLDVCYGLSFARAKGFTTAKPVEVSLSLDRAAEGEVTIASSSATELSYEVDALRGSVFLTNWTMALRGAGDRNRDGQVTLFEAYSYAYEQTVLFTTRELRRMQHPSYTIELSGERDITLTRPNHYSSGIIFDETCPPGRYGVVDINRNAYYGEVSIQGSSEFLLALNPGTYELLRVTKDSTALAVVNVSTTKPERVGGADFRRAPLAIAAAKGFMPLHEQGGEGAVQIEREPPTRSLLTRRSWSAGLSYSLFGAGLGGHIGWWPKERIEVRLVTNYSLADRLDEFRSEYVSDNFGGLGLFFRAPDFVKIAKYPIPIAVGNELLLFDRGHEFALRPTIHLEFGVPMPGGFGELFGEWRNVFSSYAEFEVDLSAGFRVRF